MCFHPEAGSILVEEIMRRGLCRKRKPFSGFASHWKPPLMPIEHSFRSNFIPSHCISLPHFPFTPLCLCQQVAHKHTCLPWSQGAAGQKAPSAAHLSPPPPPQPALPNPASSRAHWLTLQMVRWEMGQPGQLLGGAVGKRGGCQIPTSSLVGASHGWTERTPTDSWVCSQCQCFPVWWLFSFITCVVLTLCGCYLGQVSFEKRDSWSQWKFPIG